MTNGEDGGPRVRLADSIANARNILQAARDWLPTLMIGPASVADSADANERIVAVSAEYASLCESLRVPYLEGRGWFSELDDFERKGGIYEGPPTSKGC
jgi:hypothetical protein